jgi:CheY-like chemotaxis protein
MTASSTSLLVVDDDHDIREMAKLLLEVSGYRVTTAADGLEAWQRLEDGDSPALILLDLMMPRMDGEHFLQTLRASPRASIPVVIISGHAAVATKARELEANGWLTKPFELDALLAIVETLVADPTRPTEPPGDARDLDGPRPAG